MLPSPTLCPDSSPPLSPPPPSSVPPPSLSPAQPPPPTLTTPPVPEPTPMDNLLAVAELELELQSSALPDTQYFRPEEEVARDVMSFDLGEPKVPDEIFFDRKTHAPERVEEDNAFPGDIVSHKDLFESISEAHYLPELGGPHDEALLESLVEKGCEDNQILGQALDKLAHLVTTSGEYVEEEDDMLLGGAPVADIIDRLESLESASRSSMTAAQGLLHLHHIGDHLPPREHTQNPVNDYMTDEVFEPEADSNTAECAVETHSSSPKIRKTPENNQLDYEQSTEERVKSSKPANILYTEQVPDLNETYEQNEFKGEPQTPQILPEEDDVALTAPMMRNNNDIGIDNEEIGKATDELECNEEIDDIDKQDSMEDQKPSVEVLAKMNENPEGPKDLSIVYIHDDGEPRDLTVRKRMATPHASPRVKEIPRAPSRESDAMQSPQPSGIPAIASPEGLHAPPSKNKTQFILDAMFTSSSPKMYLTSEVSITKQHCQPLNLGKEKKIHRKSASPTVSSCSEEKFCKSSGEPIEKRAKRNSIDDLYQISRILKKKDNKLSKKGEQDLFLMSPLKQFQNLRANKSFNIPDPLLIPKDRFTATLLTPGKEIPALLVERPELLSQDDFDEERDRNIYIITIKEFEDLLRTKEIASRQLSTKIDNLDGSEDRVSDTPVPIESTTPKPSNQTTSNQRATPSMGALAEDIDAATSATFNPMLWAQYAQQMEAVAACSQNVEFLKALNASGYSTANYSELSHMLLNHPSRLMNTASFPMNIQQMDYDRLHLAFCQDVMQKIQAQRRKPSSVEAQIKEMAAKSSEFQSPYVHSTNKNYQSRSHSSARTSPITNNYSNQRAAMGQHPYIQGMYPALGNVRPNAPSMPMGGLVVPYYNPSTISSQRSPRSAHHKSPTPPSPSPYYANNNYLQVQKANESTAVALRAIQCATDNPRPRISVKNVDDMRRRQDETEVGSTTMICEQSSEGMIWNPLFGWVEQMAHQGPNNCLTQWPWPTVSATGD